ncbi:MAG: flagellar hook-associated protein FlgK, partial [Candidatus Zixiibacteriota bacterium]
MPGLFQSLEIGRRALMTYQANLQTIGHNIANVNTPGFTRQRVRLTSTFPESNAIGQFGTGVTVADVRQVRDIFLGRQYREANKSLGNWTYRSKTLQQIESLFNEPGDNTLGTALNRFWDAWSDLSTNPDATNRRAVLNRANEMINHFKQLATQLDDLYTAVDKDLDTMSKDINSLTSVIAQLNNQIAAQELGGKTANDLRDKRDLMIDQLSNLIDVRTIEHSNGTVTVLMGAMMLVDGSDAFEISADVKLESGVQKRSLTWQGTDVELANNNGQLAGLLETRDKIIPAYREKLNELAKAVVTQVNALHRAGYGLDNTTGIDFFDPNFQDAANLRINTEITDDINKIAAAAVPDGYAQNAL